VGVGVGMCMGVALVVVCVFVLRGLVRFASDRQYVETMVVTSTVSL
jgi:hypothetical protein